MEAGVDVTPLLFCVQNIQMNANDWRLLCEMSKNTKKTQKNEKTFKKPLDKIERLWYNI